jgi:hypothetical protein
MGANLAALNLDQAYLAGPASGTPHINLTTAEGPFHVDGVALAAGRQTVQLYTRGVGALNTALQTDFDPTAGILYIATGGVGGLKAESVLLPGRATFQVRLDNLRLLPDDRVFTAAPADTGRIDFVNELELNFPSASFRAFVAIAGTVLNRQNGGGFGNGLLFNHANAYGNVSGITANLGPIFTLVDQASFTATAAAITHSQQNSVRIQPSYNTASGGTMSPFAAVPHQQILIIANYNAGVTVGAGGREAIRISNAAGAGTMTGPQTGIRVASMAFGTGLQRGVWIEQDSPGRSLDIDGSGSIHLGNGSATIGFFGTTPAAQPPAYTPTNVTTDRSYDANSTTINELSDVVGTMIADLQSLGIFQ